MSAGATATAVALCWLLVVSDGYDLIVFGTVQTSLIEETGWGLTNTTAGTVGSVAFVGMMLGAFFGGRLGDTFGRKKTIVWCTIAFTVFNALCGLAGDAVVFGALRFLAGLGLGGLLPSLNALTGDLVSARWRPAMATLMMSGVPVGGTVAALLGTVVIPEFGWRWMFFLTLWSLLLIPLALRFLPEATSPAPRPEATSPAPRSAGHDGASTTAALSDDVIEPRTGIFGPSYRWTSLLFAAATLAILFTWYGLGTWLPRLMELQGHDLGSALTFTIALNMGAAAGSVVTAWTGARFGPLVSGIGATLAAAVGLVALISGEAPITLVYLLLLFAGVGTHGAQCLVIGAVNNAYPTSVRGTALGWSLGVGRIGAVLAPQAGGLLLGTALGVAAVYMLFAASAVLAAVLLVGLIVLATRRTARAGAPEHVA